MPEQPSNLLSLSDLTDSAKLNPIERAKELLKDRGISEVEVGISRQINVLAENMPKIDSAKENTREVLKALELPEEEIEIEVREITFKEMPLANSSISDFFPDRNVEQKLKLYTFQTAEGDPKDPKSAPLILFSHGGSIRPDTNLNSSFLALISEYGIHTDNPLIIASVDHRGSDSEDSKTNYCLDDRVGDLEVALLAMEDVLKEFEEKGVSWNGELILIGNSMGGHVASKTAELLQPEKLVLVQPAAYPSNSEFLQFGKPFSDSIRVSRAWKTSLAFDSLETYLKNGGNALVIGAEEDEVIPGGVTKAYMKEVTWEFTRRAVEAEGNTHEFGYLWINQMHTKTTPEEIRGIVEYISN